MSFLIAWRLWLLLAVGGLAGAWVSSLYRRRRDVVRFTNVALLDVVAPERSAWRRHLPALLWLVALALLVVGFARPVRDVKVPKDRATVVVTLDVSTSMEATDVSPSRIEVARTAALDFVEGLPEGVSVGLVLFSGTTQTLPASTDRELVVDELTDADLSDYTAIGNAIFAALEVVESAPPAENGEPAPARIVVLSDGETTTGRPDADAAEAAADAGVPVDTIAFGTPNGTITDADGFEIDVAVAPGPLRDIAETTGGEFFEADSLDRLSSVYDDLATAVGFEDAEREVSGWFIGFALLLLTAAGLLSLLWSQRLP